MHENAGNSWAELIFYNQFFKYLQPLKQGHQTKNQNNNSHIVLWKQRGALKEKFIINAAGVEGSMKTTRRSNVLIGRLNKWMGECPNDIILKDDQVSRIHVELKTK